MQREILQVVEERKINNLQNDKIGSTQQQAISRIEQKNSKHVILNADFAPHVILNEGFAQ